MTPRFSRIAQFRHADHSEDDRPHEMRPFQRRRRVRREIGHIRLDCRIKGYDPAVIALRVDELEHADYIAAMGRERTVRMERVRYPDISSKLRSI